MNMIEAAKRAGNDMWFRPLSWHGTGCALCFDGRYLCEVPTSRGARPSITLLKKDVLSGQWAVVDPDTVNNEI